MKEFLMRGIEEEIEIEEACTINASRLRTNRGHSSIKIEVDFVNGNKQYIEFSSDTLGDKYQTCAEKFIKIFKKIVENSCELPKE